MRADLEKTRAVVDWPVSEIWNVNFYRQFIRDYSQTESPLPRLTSIHVSFHLSPEADEGTVVLSTHRGPARSQPPI